MKRFLLFLFLLAGAPVYAQGILGFHPADEVVPRLLSARKPVLSEDGTAAVASWTLLYCSDLHGCDENLARIVSFRNAYTEWIDDALHTGDSVADCLEDGNPWNRVEGAGGLMNTVGNHDCNLLYGKAAAEETYRALMAPFIDGWDVDQPAGVRDPGSPHYGACYYSKDYPASRLRLIVLDGARYSEAQDEWFAECLADAARKRLNVVAVNHFPPENGMDCIDCGFSERGEKIGPATLHRLPDGAYGRVDRFLDEGGRFVCWLGGHFHQDFVGHVRGHGRQFQILVDKAGKADWWMEEDRTPGTRNQDAFNLLTVNPGRGLLIIDRIGCDRDPYMRGKRLFVYDYIKREVLVTE